jgi:hypothetical protein
MTISTAQVVSLNSSLALLGATSGSVTLTPPAVAGTQAYTLPTAQPTASGQALVATTAGVMSWAAVTASPAGSTTQFQYNNAGAFAGASNLTYAANGPVVTSLGVGSTTPSASGAGIAFPATQSASTDANTLDDYEEGTWTPTQGSAITGVTGTFTASGNYTKVGRLVTVNFTASATSFTYTTGAGSVLGSMPFTPGASNSYGSGVNAAGSVNLPFYVISSINSVYSTVSFTTSSINGTITFFV